MCHEHASHEIRGGTSNGRAQPPPLAPDHRYGDRGTPANGCGRNRRVSDAAPTRFIAGVADDARAALGGPISADRILASKRRLPCWTAAGRSPTPPAVYSENPAFPERGSQFFSGNGKQLPETGKIFPAGTKSGIHRNRAAFERVIEWSIGRFRLRADSCSRHSLSSGRLMRLLSGSAANHTGTSRTIAVSAWPCSRM